MNSNKKFGFRIILIIEKRELTDEPIPELSKLIEGVKISTDIENLDNFDVGIFAEEKKRQLIDELKRMMKN